MKIGMFGNTNNSMFAMGEVIRSLGHDVALVLTSKELPHRPESRTPEVRSGYPDWIIDASDLEEWDYFVLSPRIEPVWIGHCDVTH
jgi:hypothetical protein